MLNRPILSTAAALVLVLGVACDRTSPAVKQAQEAAKAADDRVAALEKQLEEIKAGKVAGEGDADAAIHVSQAQVKALDRRLDQAKKAAAQRHTEAQELAAAPKAVADRAVLVEVPANTRLIVEIGRDLATDKDQAGDAWEGTLAEPVSVNGRVVWPKGTPVKGVVAQSTPAGRLQSGQGGLGIRLTTVGANDVEAGTFLVVGDKRGERNTKFIGGTAALGALVGILSSRNNQGDHALGGAAIGAAAGTALAAGTADTIIKIPAAKPVAFTLSAPERVVLK
ncbi:hypothetical protein [Mesoterricola sediminis]|uniref:Uncharacterized protein n=1 Tax=Mesoterricola sediminis TaxID=2927980 RepID=A0AA48GQX2_9BACT|nr:hypothetical protein [Mesoterricola sediminis]BDU75969.1 hypothetical protein METESE_09270 [Mesoterricola sediminis]